MNFGLVLDFLDTYKHLDYYNLYSLLYYKYFCLKKSKNLKIYKNLQRKITILEIYNCKIYDKDFLFFKNLSYLKLTVCNIYELNIDNFKNIKYIEYSVCEFSKKKLELKNLKNILEFKLNFNNNLRNLDISNCPNLKIVNCSKNKLDNILFSDCKKLFIIKAHSNYIAYLDICRCECLRIFKLWCSKIHHLDLKKSQHIIEEIPGVLIIKDKHPNTFTKNDLF